jgi:hypothetical protein
MTKGYISRSNRRLFVLGLVVMLAVGVLPRSTQHVSAHAGPWETAVHWDYSRNCITYVKGSNYLEDIVKNTLPNEWFDTWPSEALNAGAELIRTDGYYFYTHPENQLGLCNQSGTTAFNFRDSRMYYVANSRKASTDSATDYTHPYGWTSNNNYIFYEFNSCYQYKTRDRANAGLLHTSIIFQYYNEDAQACGLPGHTGNAHISIN